MWLAGQIVRASGGDVSGISVAMGALAVLATLVTSLLTLRGTTRNQDVQREAEFDKRVDARLMRLEELRQAAEERNVELLAELHRYQEMYARLRLDVYAAGHDPDQLGRRPPGDQAQR